MKNYRFLLVLIAVLMVSCAKKRDIAPNIQSTVAGRAYDENNQEPYPNLKIRIGAYEEKHSTFSTTKALVRYVDSAVTDADGNFKINFSTIGKANAYYLDFGNVAKNVIYISDKGGHTSLPNYLTKVIAIGGTNSFNFDVHKQYYMRSRVIVQDNPKPPVYIIFQSAHDQIGGGPGYIIYGKSNDTTVNIPIVKNTDGYKIYFYIADANGQNSLTSPVSTFPPAIVSDTIPGPVFNLRPATFK